MGWLLTWLPMHMHKQANAVSQTEVQEANKLCKDTKDFYILDHILYIYIYIYRERERERERERWWYVCDRWSLTPT
jgi:hypothetical protein